jgi:hypothetical protein
MRIPKLPLALLGALVAAPGADAATLQCTTADKSTWLAPAAVQKMLQQHGFTNVGAPAPNEGNCYVVQATDTTGARKTLYLDPTDGALMAVE